jgi:phospholipase/lecithinase/hemolysin
MNGRAASRGLAAAGVGTLLLMAAAELRAAPVSAIYAFGDSLSDIGNLAIATGGAFPASPPYAAGRRSGSTTWRPPWACRCSLPSQGAGISPSPRH